MHGENDNRNNNGIDIGKTAVAIEYVPGEAAPKILATGKGVIADKIIERAKEIVSRREGKEVYYKAADTEQSRLLHIMIEQVLKITCPGN